MGGRREQGHKPHRDQAGAQQKLQSPREHAFRSTEDTDAQLKMLSAKGHSSKGSEDAAGAINTVQFLLLPLGHFQYPPHPLTHALRWVPPDPLQQTRSPSVSATTVASHPETGVCWGAQSCLTLRPPGLQPARLLCPWDSPDKNTRAGCHLLLQQMPYVNPQTITY